MVIDDETAVPDALLLTGGSAEMPTDFFLENNPETLPEPPAAKPVQKHTSALPRGPRLKVEDVVSYFSPCGRCGYFLAGYWAANGRADLITAVERAKSGWLSLTWNLAVRQLVLNSYAIRIEENDFHYEGCCSECRRHFIFRASRSPNHPHTFRIEMKPRKRQ
ncbi:MAG: hypothetical protein IPM39_22930 [Chloroflexi bacterium]|nr:hypothetical protein [Chloroflexota bacterium]